MVLVQILILDCLLCIFSDLMYNFKLHWHPCFKKTGSLMAATGNCSYSSSSHCAKISELNSLQNVSLVKPSPRRKEHLVHSSISQSCFLPRSMGYPNPVCDQPTDSTFHALECSQTLFMDFLSKRSGPTGLAWYVTRSLTYLIWYVTSSMLLVPVHSFCILATIRACEYNLVLPICMKGTLFAYILANV